MSIKIRCAENSVRTLRKLNFQIHVDHSVRLPGLCPCRTAGLKKTGSRFLTILKPGKFTGYSGNNSPAKQANVFRDTQVLSTY
jgi:hypothetical protein